MDTPDLRTVADETSRRAIGTVFIVAGFALASWLSRLPDIRDVLGLTPGQVGMLLLCLSTGTLLALPTSGLVVNAITAPRTVLAGGVLTASGLVTMAAGLGSATVPVVGAGLFAYGLGVSYYEVAMNIGAADVERRLGRTLMPRFHAGFSIGTVAGALVGAVASHLSLDLDVQLMLTAVVMFGIVASVLRLLPTAPPADPEAPGMSPLAAWREPRTLVIGLVVLSFALCEGIANDWIALALVDGYDVPAAVGSAGFAVFVAAMTTGRLVGGPLIDRFGRVPTLRVTALSVGVGVLLVVASPHPAGAFVGALFWGVGASLGFPLGMTAAGEDSQHAPARLAVVSSIGYAAFLGGPPLVGAIADQVGVRTSILVALPAALVGLALARSVSPPAVSRPR